MYVRRCERASELATDSTLAFCVPKGELEAHKKLHSDLQALNSAIDGWKADPSSYDAQKLKALLDELTPNFRTHLHEEVGGLAKERLEPKVTSQELKDCIAKLEEEAKKGNPFVDPVFMMSHTSKEHKVSVALVERLSYRR